MNNRKNKQLIVLKSDSVNNYKTCINKQTY